MTNPVAATCRQKTKTKYEYVTGVVTRVTVILFLLPAMDPPLGAVVSIPPGRGVVRYSGTTKFAAGKWIGVELSEPNGKNDGSVNNVVYFSCRFPYGVFVRQSQIKSIHGMEQDPAVSHARCLQYSILT